TPYAITTTFDLRHGRRSGGCPFSYRAVVIQTVQFYPGDCLGLNLPLGLVTPALVETCKLMGGFNNDWDS
ncbi:hypothetical protein, partial [Candidatus Amarolinea dominans]|uniref:hypothetical protein n=1 Tax=Candidatus Amarolinea dominans TaxID=3140696 RepID=UPI0031CC4264